MIAVASVVPQQPRRTVVRGNQEIEVAVVVDVAVRRATRDDALLEGGAGAQADVLELLCPEVPEQVRRLRIGDLRLDLVDVVRDMPVRGKDIEPAVEIRVEEEARERQRQQRRLPDRGRWGFVDEQAIPLVLVERHHLVREVADDDRLPA